MTNFKVDVLLKTLEELQKEKNHNEQLLTKEYTKRKTLEKKVENSMSLLTQKSERHARMLETVRMEEQRVAQTQAQIQKYEQVNDIIQERITQLNDEIAKNEERRHFNLEDFEQKMVELVEKFRSGWQNLEGSGLDNINQYEEEKVKLLEQAEACNAKLKTLNEQVEREQKNSVEEPVDGLLSVLEEVCKMFEMENKESKMALEKNKQRLHVLEEELAVLLEGNRRHGDS